MIDGQDVGIIPWGASILSFPDVRHQTDDSVLNLKSDRVKSVATHFGELIVVPGSMGN